MSGRTMPSAARLTRRDLRLLRRCSGLAPVWRSGVPDRQIARLAPCFLTVEIAADGARVVVATEAGREIARKWGG